MSIPLGARSSSVVSSNPKRTVCTQAGIVYVKSLKRQIMSNYGHDIYFISTIIDLNNLNTQKWILLLVFYCTVQFLYEN